MLVFIIVIIEESYIFLVNFLFIFRIEEVECGDRFISRNILNICYMCYLKVVWFFEVFYIISYRLYIFIFLNIVG